MSTTVDQRVVEMQFDNRHFERNVSTTMSTLDKLKQRLNFTGASKGLAEVGTAAKNVNMNGLGNAVENVRMRFSALEVMGVTALANITNSAVNAGKRMLSALTIDPVKTGFQEYETQINAVQTILSNTKSKGSTIDDVNKALEELNAYADKTIYNFTEMTRNIGTFTAAGVDLDTSTNAIKGIANLAAMSGSTSQQASTAMYQLSQALASGTVKLMDWNSVVNAGMGGELFQNALKETARVHGVAIDDMIKDQGSFRETLSEGWLTSEILTETLQKFTMTTEGLTKEQIEANKQMLKAKGYTEDQIEAIFELGEDATNAATKVKTFTQLWDVLKESAQSGWAQTWKLIIGDFEEAKGFLTPLADALTGFINKMSDWRNKIIEGALGKSFGKLKENFTTLIKPAAKAMDTIKETVNTVTDLGKIVDEVILGKFGNGEDRFNALSEAGINYYEVQNKVNEKLGDSFRYTKDEIDAQNKLLKVKGESNEKTEESVKAETKLTDIQKDRIAGLAKMDEAALRSLGYTDDQIAAFRELAITADKLGLSVEDFINNIDEIDGRWLLLNSFKNIGKALIDVFTVLKTAWQDVFPPKSIEERSEQLFNIIAALHKFTTSLKMNSDTTKDLFRVFKGLFAILDVISTITGGALKIAFKVLNEILSRFDLNLLDVLANIGDAAVKFRDWIDSIFDVSAAVDVMIPFIKKAIETIKNWASAVKDSEAFEVATNIVLGLIEGLKGGAKKVWDSAVEMAKGILEKVKEVLGIHSPSREMEEVGTNTIDGFVNGIRNGASKVWNTVKDVFLKVVEFAKQLDLGALLVGALGIGTLTASNKIGNALEAFASPFEGFGDVMSGVGDVLSKSSIPIARVVWKSANVVQQFSKVLKGAANVLNGISFKLKAEAIKELTISLAILIGAIALLAYACKDDAKAMWNAVGIVAALAAVLVGLSVALNFISKSSLDISKDGLKMDGVFLGVLAIASSLLLVALAVKMISKLDPEAAKQGFLGLAGMVVAMAAVMAACKFLLKSKDGGNVGSTLLKISAAILVLVYVAKMISGMSWKDMGKAAIGMSYLVGVIALLIGISSMAGNNIDKIGGTMVKLSIAMGLLVGVAKLIATMSWDDMGKAGIGMLGLVGIIASLLAVSKIAGKDMAKIGGTMMALSTAIMLMAVTIQILAGLDKEQLIKGVTCIVLFSGIITGLIAATKLAGKDLGRIGLTILAMSLAIAVMAAATAILGMVKTENLVKGLIAVGLLSAMVAGLTAVTKFSKDTTISFIGLAAAIGILAAVAALLGFVPVENLKRGIAAVGLLTIMMSMMIAATKFSKFTKSAMSSLIVMTVAIGVMATAIGILAHNVDPEKLRNASESMAMVMGMFALMSAATNGQKVNIGSLSAMLGAVLILGGIIYALSALKVGSTLETAASISLLLLTLTASLSVLSLLKVDAAGTATAIGMLALLSLVVLELGVILALINQMQIGDAMPAVMALSALIVVLTGVLAALTGLGAVISASGFIVAGGLAIAIVALGALGLVVWELGAVLNAMKTYDLGSAMPMVETLSALLVVMTGVLAACAVIGIFGTAALNGVIAMAALGLVVWELGAILNAMKSYDLGSAMPMVETLSALLTSLTDILGKLTIIGVFAPAALGGVVAMAAFGLVVWELGAILKALNSYNLDEAKPTVEVLSVLLNDLTGILGKLTVIGVFAGAAVAGVAALLIAITAIGGLLLAMGAIATDGMIKTLDKGIEVLNKIAFGLGAAVGNLVAGFVGAVGDSMIVLGAQLSMFMWNLQPFITMVKMVDEKVLKGVGIVTASILALTIADFINGILSFGSIGSSLINLGIELSGFMWAAQGFFDGVKNIDPASLECVKTLAEAIVVITAANVIDGLFGLVTGGSSLADFATQLPLLGVGLQGFANALSAFDERKMISVGAAANAIKTLAHASAEIPNTGGLLGAIVGNNDLGVFADQFPDLGIGLRGFVNHIGTFTEAEIDTVECAASAIKELASAASEIPNAGGLLGALVGENNLGTFAYQFPKLGIGLRGFIDNVGTFTKTENDTVECAAKAIKSLASAASEIPNAGGLIGSLFGENNMDTFADQFATTGQGLRDFINNIGTFTDAEVSTIKCAGNAIIALANAASNIDGQTEWGKKLFGDNSLATFSTQIASTGTGIKNFATNLGTFTNDQVATVRAGVSAINALANLADADLSEASKYLSTFGADLPAFASDVAAFCTSMPSSDTMTSAISGIQRILTAVESIADTDSGVLSNFSTNLKEVGTDAVDKFIGAFTSSTAKTDLKDAAKKLAQKVIDGFEDKHDSIKTAGEDAAEKAISGVETQEDDMKSAGKDLGSGLVKGIEAKESDVYWAGYALGQKAVQGEKDGQASKSPSKLTIQAGHWIGEGLVIGIKEMGNKVYNAGSNLGKDATGSISSAISRVTDFINSDINAQPTIRPVLDLSDVKAGVNSMGSMLNVGSSVGVLANVGSISSMMNRRGQNGANTEVVTAINKLRKDLGNVGNTYSINGINVSEGTDAADAIHTLVRVIKMEGRS